MVFNSACISQKKLPGEQGNRKLQIRILASLKVYRYMLIESSDK